MTLKEWMESVTYKELMKQVVLLDERTLRVLRVQIDFTLEGIDNVRKLERIGK